MKKINQITVNTKANLTAQRRERILLHALLDKKLKLKEKGLLAMLIMLPYKCVHSYSGVLRFCECETYSSVRATFRRLKRNGIISTKLVRVLENKNIITLMYYFPLTKYKYIISPLKNTGGYNKIEFVWEKSKKKISSFREEKENEE